MIRRPGLDLIEMAGNVLAAEGRARPWLALSLSCQDAVATEGDYRDLLGDAGYEAMTWRHDSQAIVRWHKCEHITTRIPDWHALLGQLGFHARSTDLVRARGCEEFLDLNNPHLEPRFIEAFDLVVDNAAHHCAGISTAIRNIMHMPRRGGFVLHITPLVAVNHGFYSISPTLFHDLYTRDRGYSVLRHVWYHHDPHDPACVVQPVDPVLRMKDVSTNSVQLVLARRDRVVSKFRWPMQTKFVLRPDSLNPKPRKDPPDADQGDHERPT